MMKDYPYSVRDVHIRFLEKILRIFGVDNRPLLIGASLVCFMLFTFFYICVFKCTAIREKHFCIKSIKLFHFDVDLLKIF